MRAWLGFLTRNRLLEIALAVVVGLAALELAKTISDTAVSVLAQHAGRDPFGADSDLSGLFYGPTALNITVADTIVVYGSVLAAVLTLGLVALAGVWVVRRRDRALGECPYCASRIPYDSTHCAYCGSSVASGEP
jgi:large-conductance mechanosensitive channel